MYVYIQITPLGTYQTLILMHYTGGCYVLGGFITMKDKSRESYNTAFDLLISAVRKIIPTWTPAQWANMIWMTGILSYHYT